MDPKAKEKLLRERLRLPADEEIPDYVLRYISVEPQTFTEAELAWGRSVVARVAQEKRQPI